MYKLAFIVLVFVSSFSPKPTSDYELLLVSSGFSASYGHHAIKIRGEEVFIDTSFFVSGNPDYTADKEYIQKHSEFSADLKLKTSTRKIYSLLASTPIKEFKRKEALYNKVKCVYQVQEMTVLYKNKKVQYKFHLTESCCPANEKEFVHEFQLLFPFGYYFGVNSQKFYSSDL